MLRVPLQRPPGLTDEEWDAYLKEALGIIQDETPVRTGRLQAGWFLRNLGGSAELRNDVPYGKYVQNGTPRMSPNDMIGRTLGQLR